MTQIDLGSAISGIYETHLTVSDLQRSIAFYRDRLGLELAKKIPERNIAFFWIGQKSDGMLGLWGSGSGPMKMSLHFAFRTTQAAVLSACENLQAVGIAPLGFHGEPVSEPVVIGWMPAVSVYFKDPDGHSIELLSVLDQSPDMEFSVGPYSSWLAKHGA